MRSTHTQRAAYDALDGGARRSQKKVILDLFHNPALTLTRQQIADRTNMRLGSVCGRVRELIDDAELVVRGMQKCAATGQQNETLGLAVAS